MNNAFLREDETRRALADFVLSTPRLSMDSKCREFEQAFATFQGSGDAVLFNSGGSANLAILQAFQNLGCLRRRDKIGFSAVTWSTNTMPIIQLGMEPVAVDCEPLTLNVMAGNLLSRLEQTNLRALFLTNALGFAGDLGQIRRICLDREILLIEDNCESLGTELADGRTGNFGICASFSFYVAHHMSSIEGGMVCTSDFELAEMLRIVRANGWDRNLTAAQQEKWRKRCGVGSEFQAKYSFYDLGYNLRPTEITGFLGLHQLKYVAETFRKRENNYLRLEQAVLKNPSLLRMKRNHIRLLSSFAFPVVCVDPGTRTRLIERFQRADVEIRPLVAGSMQRQPFYSKYVHEVYPTPGADFLDECAFYFSNSPDLTEADLSELAECLSA